MVKVNYNYRILLILRWHTKIPNIKLKFGNNFYFATNRIERVCCTNATIHCTYILNNVADEEMDNFTKFV